MKKLRYSAGMKATVLAAEQILIVVLVLCLLLLLLLHERNILNFGEKAAEILRNLGILLINLRQRRRRFFNLLNCAENLRPMVYMMRKSW